MAAPPFAILLSAMPLHPSIPRASDAGRFGDDPLRFLAEGRAALGDVFVLREDGAIFSRTPDCNGVVAVFGAGQHRAVLTDTETFGMPPSAARHLDLNERLTNLNRSLHSMRGEQHDAQKRVLTSVLDRESVDEDELREVLQAFAAQWQPGARFGLLGTMRALTLRLASRVLFGGEHEELSTLLEGYFHLRREAASPAAGGRIGREELIEVGEALDDALRTYLRGGAPGGLVGKLARAGLSEDEIVGHANILFVSSTEPIAVALTWTLLILSQLPDLRARLREDASLLDGVISESLRILPPNGIMVRITTRPATLAGIEVPERCEIVICPFVAHRDPARFPDPEEFRPSRWTETRPSPFQYFPFGAGGHACVGRGLALRLMHGTLTFLLARHHLLLDGDQEIDWRLHIMFMPANDPRMIVDGLEAGMLAGPVAALLRLS